MSQPLDEIVSALAGRDAFAGGIDRWLSANSSRHARDEEVRRLSSSRLRLLSQVLEPDTAQRLFSAIEPTTAGRVLVLMPPNRLGAVLDWLDPDLAAEIV